MLLIRLMKKHHILVVLSLCMSGIAAGITLWWNAILSLIINQVSAGKMLSASSLIAPFFFIVLTCLAAYGKTLASGYTCECMAHSLRMGYARYLSGLPFAKAEQLNTGEQFSKLQNEISDISDYLGNSLFPIFDDAMRFLITFSWFLILNTKLTILSGFGSSHYYLLLT